MAVDMDLKAFMKEELRDKGTMEFEGIDRFVGKDGKPVPFIIRRLSMREIRDIRELYRKSEVFRDKRNGGRPVVENGQVVMARDYDAEKAGLHIMVDAFVQPRLDDEELMEYYGVLDRLDMPETLFPSRSEFKYANECVMIACGLMDGEDEGQEIEGIKN